VNATPRLALCAAAAVGVQVGATIVATRSVVGELGPASIAFVRYAIALLTLLPALRWSGQRWRLPPRDAIVVMLLGIGQFGLLIAWLNMGLQTVASASAALIFAGFPLLTLLLAWLAGQERLDAAKLAGVACTLAGVAVALGRSALQLRVASGEGAVLASAFTGALCSVLVRPYLQRHTALTVGVWAMGGAVLFLASWSALESGGFGAVSKNGWLALAFIGLSSGIGYFLWLWALRHAPASRVTLLLALSPLTALLLGALWLHEPVPPRLWPALGLVIAGLAIAHHRVR
jgi:drug/metabolite transporter (DMT)-like permease